MPESNKPVHRLRYGNVVASVFLNNSQVGYFYDTVFQRIYREGDLWGNSASFEDRDLPNLAKAAADIHTWIYQQKAQAVTVNGSDAASCPTRATDHLYVALPDVKW